LPIAIFAPSEPRTRTESLRSSDYGRASIIVSAEESLDPSASSSASHLSMEEQSQDRELLRLPLLTLLNLPSRSGLLSNAKPNRILTDGLPFGGTCPPS